MGGVGWVGVEGRGGSSCASGPGGGRPRWRRPARRRRAGVTATVGVEGAAGVGGAGWRGVEGQGAVGGAGGLGGRDPRPRGLDTTWSPTDRCRCMLGCAGATSPAQARSRRLRASCSRGRTYVRASPRCRRQSPSRSFPASRLLRLRRLGPRARPRRLRLRRVGRLARPRPLRLRRGRLSLEHATARPLTPFDARWLAASIARTAARPAPRSRPARHRRAPNGLGYRRP